LIAVWRLAPGSGRLCPAATPPGYLELAREPVDDPHQRGSGLPGDRSGDHLPGLSAAGYQGRRCWRPGRPGRPRCAQLPGVRSSARARSVLSAWITTDAPIIAAPVENRAHCTPPSTVLITAVPP